VGGSAQLTRGLNRSVPGIPNLDQLTGGEALALLHETIGRLSPA
jgi:hypothetical protein